MNGLERNVVDICKNYLYVVVFYDIVGRKVKFCMNMEVLVRYKNYMIC